MRVLLLHPEDLPDRGPWSREHWDLVIDLGFAGSTTYADWAQTLKCPVLSPYSFVRQIESYRCVNQIFQQGRGQLLDRVGLDWWEILAMERYQDVLALLLLRELRGQLPPVLTELWASQPHRLARMGEQVLGVSVKYFRKPGDGRANTVMRALQFVRNMRPPQMVEIAFDKWDSGFDLRRHWAKHRRPRLREACLLMPSAYSNVTRSVMAYAEQLPRRKFLLLTTRANANPTRKLANVRVGSIASYVHSADKTWSEAASLAQEWRTFANRMKDNSEEFKCISAAGLWDYFPQHLQHGLRLREAWTAVFECEPVTGVLCGDDLNYHTRLPLISAQMRGLKAVYCSHGALDGGFLFKLPFADSFLVKGDMERDYLQRAAGIPQEKIVVGAPGRQGPMTPERRSQDAIVFFSQPYEVLGGRADSIYRELIPSLSSVASAIGRKLIVKLHPFESRRARQVLINSLVPTSGLSLIEVVDEMEPARVMSRAWCGLTVNSSVAVECALQDIPFFLCGWLDLTGMGYLDQFARFDVARVLRAPEEIERIPEMVAGYRPDPTRLARLWKPADAHQLEETLFGKRQVILDACAC